LTATNTGTSGLPTLREDKVAYAGVVGQAGMLRDGRLSATELVEILLRRIARMDGRLRAFRVVLAEQARAEAAAADADRREGDPRPLLGVPVAVKDNVAIAGQAALHGTGSPEPVATSDAEVVRRLRNAGMVVIGITQLPELALWAATESQTHGITRNPWDHRRSPGGSSGGSAAAVAAGMVAAAHATDGLGSIRIPASACGLVGLKPTHGLVPIADHWHGLSHAGFLTRSVRDTAVMLDAVTDGGGDLAGRLEPPARLRIAVSTKAPTPVRPVADVRRTMDRAVDLLRELGHVVVDRDPPYGAALAAGNTVRYLTGMAEELDGLVDPGATESRTRALAALGRTFSSSALEWACRQGEELAAAMADFFGDVDLLLTPTMPVLPRPAGCLAGHGVLRTVPMMLPCAAYTGPWNAAGLPAVSLPVGVTANGVPIGVQLVGPRHGEATLLAVAAALEPAACWLDRRVSEPAADPRLA
jgi:amidase